jgi:hypothetical protein
MTIRIRTDDENRELLKSIRDAHEKVEKWPNWKRNLKVSQFSPEITLNDIVGKWPRWKPKLSQLSPTTDEG